MASPSDHHRDVADLMTVKQHDLLKTWMDNNHVAAGITDSRIYE